MLAFDDAMLEGRHDFIQWLFPLPEPSGAVPGAPVLTLEDREAITTSHTARERLRRAAARMLAFYAAGDQWRAPFDHNHLRITRIIRSLRLLLGDAEADGFKAAIEQLAADAPIDATARGYWARA